MTTNFISYFMGYGDSAANKCSTIEFNALVAYTLVNSAGLNMKVCSVISIAQCLLWALWAVMTRHPSRLKIIFVAMGGAAAVLLEAYDIPPRWGYVDGRAICLAVAIPCRSFGGALPRKMLRCEHQLS